MKLQLLKAFLLFLAFSANLGGCPRECRCRNSALSCKNARGVKLVVGGRLWTSIVLENTTISSVTCAPTETSNRLHFAFFVSTGPPHLLCQLLKCGSVRRVAYYDKDVSQSLPPLSTE